MDENIISPFIRVAMHSTLPKGLVFKKRVIYDYEIIYVQSGSCRILLDDGEIECKKNDVIFIRPGVSHTIIVSKDEDFNQPHIHFDAVYDSESSFIPVSFKDCSEMSDAERKNIREDIFCDIPIPMVFVPENMTEFRKSFFSVINTFTALRMDTLKLKAEMLSLLNLVIKQFSKKKQELQGSSEIVLSFVKEYIDANHMNIITLDGIATLFSLNKYTALRKFKEKYGCTIISYYNQKRFETAARLLETTELAVKEIGEALNFSDEYTFSRFFKNFCGKSPTSYRRNMKEIDRK